MGSILMVRLWSCAVLPSLTQDLQLVVGTVYLVARCATDGDMFDDDMDGGRGWLVVGPGLH
jgi:hypothetical protein